MKLIYFKPFLVFLLILSAISCKKEFEFPEITQEGKGTFGCIIDGKKYVPEDLKSPLSPRVISASLEQIGAGEYHYLVISVSNDKTKKIGHFKISYYGALEDLHEGKFDVTDPAIVGRGFSSEIFRGDLYTYATDENTEGAITILKFDKRQKIISGTFAFPMFHSKTGERIEVTEGRFYLKFD